MKKKNIKLTNSELARYLGLKRTTTFVYPPVKKELMILGLGVKQSINNVPNIEEYMTTKYSELKQEDPMQYKLIRTGLIFKELLDFLEQKNNTDKKGID